MPLDYPITRSFSWRWFSPISLAGSFIVIVFLSVLNSKHTFSLELITLQSMTLFFSTAALTGYETVTVFESDFNVTQSHWFDNGFLAFHQPKPGTLCEPRVFNVGDPLTTNYSFFQWNMDSIIQPNAGQSGISYGGTPLTFCDVTSIYLDGSILSWSMDFTVISSCVDADSFNVTARTSFSMGLLPGRYSPLLGLRLASDGTQDARGQILDGLLSCIFFSFTLLTVISRLSTATQDLGTRVYNALLFSNQTSAVTLSAQANFNYCPMSLGLDAPCAVNPPQFDIFAAAVVFPNSTIHYYTSQIPMDPVWNPWVFDNDTELAFFNLIQAVYASVRIDLGNPSLNNFILYPEAMNNTIAPTFPITPANGEAFSNSSLYTILSSPFPWLQQNLPVTLSGPATIQVVYPCQFQQRKTPGALITSVLVATLSMFSTGWAVFMLLATTVAKRNNPAGLSAWSFFLPSDLSLVANRCEGHCFRHRLDLDPSWFDEAYGLSAGEFSTRKVSDGKGVAYQTVVQSPSSHSRDLDASDTEVGSIKGHLGTEPESQLLKDNELSPHP